MAKPHPPAKQRRRRWPRRVGVGLLLFVLLLGGLYVFRQPLFGRMLADKVSAALSESLDLPVRVERVLGSWIADARVEGVTVETGPRSGALVDFSAKSLVVRFSLWHILKGDVVNAIEGVEAEALRIVLDPSKAPPAPPNQEEMSLAQVIESVPAKFPPMNIDADVEVRTEMGVFRIAGMSITCPGSNVISLDAKQILLPEPAGDVGALHARLRRDADGLKWESKSQIAGIELSAVDADEQGNVTAKATVANAPLDLSWGSGRASVKTGAMQVAAVPAWVLRLIPIENARPSSGSLAFALDASQLDPLIATASITGRDLVLPEDRVSSIDIAAHAKDGLLHLDSATARASSATLDASGIVLDPSRPLGLAAVDKLSLQAKDLRRFVETLDRPVRADISIRSKDGRRATIEQLELSGEGVNLKADGFVDLANAADTPASESLIKNVNLIWRGRAVDIEIGPVKIRGHLAGSGKAQGTLDNPSVEVDLEGADLMVKDVLLATVNGRATLKGDVATFESLSAKGPGLTLTATGQVDLAQERVREVSFQMNATDLSAFRDVYVRMGLPELAGRCAIDGRLDGAFASPSGAFHLDAQALKIDTFDVGSIVVVMTSDGSDVKVTKAEAKGGWGRVALTAQVSPSKRFATITAMDGMFADYAASLKQPTSVRWSDGVQIRDLNLTLLGGELTAQVDLEPSIAIEVAFSGLDVGAVLKEVEGTASGHVSVQGEAGRATVSIPNLVAQGQTGRLDLNVEQAATGLVVEALELVAGDALQVRAKGQLPWRLSKDGLLPLAIESATFDASVAIQDARTWLADAPVGQVAAEITVRGTTTSAKGHVRSVAVGELPPLARVAFDITADAQATRVRVAVEQDERLDAELRGTIAAGWLWNDPARLPADAKSVSADAALTVRSLDLSVLRSWVPSDIVSDLSGVASADIKVSGTLDDPRVAGIVDLKQARLVIADVPQPISIRDLAIVIDDTSIALRQGSITYATATLQPTGRMQRPATLTGDWMAQRVQAQVVVDAPDVGVFASFIPDVTGLRGVLAGTLTAIGTLDQPKLGGSINGTSLAFVLGSPLIEGAPLDVQIPQLSVALVDDRIDLRNATISAGNASATISGTFTLPRSQADFASSPLSVTLRAELPDLSLIQRFVPESQGVQGRLATDLTVSGTAASPFVDGWIEARDVRYPLPEQELIVTLPSLRVQASRERVTIQQAQLQVRDVRVQLAGDIAVPRTGYRGDWMTQPLNATVDIDVPTLDVLDLVGRDLARLRGQIKGSIRATGTANAPILAGEVDLVEITGRLPGGLSRIDGLSGRIQLQDRSVSLQNMRGALGRAPFTLSGGARWAEGSDPTIDVRLQGTNLQLMRSNELRVRANVDIAIAGAINKLAARGEVTLADVVYAVRMDALGGGGPASAGAGDRIELFSIEDGPLSKMTFDIGIRADRTIRVRTNMIRGNVSADLRLLGTGVAPVLDGSASFPGLLVKLPFSSLKVDAGEASFARTRPGQPRIQAEARTTMQGYDLTVTLDGVYPDVEVRVSSNPPLSQQDALLLLTTGATTDQLQKEGIARAALTRIATVFGKRLLASGVGPEDPDEKGLFDRIEFVQGRRISRSGQETIEAEVELTEKLFLRLERDRYDDFNAGVVWRWKFR